MLLSGAGAEAGSKLDRLHNTASEQSFLLKKTLHKVILIYFTNLFKLDPDPNFKSSWIRLCIQKYCWIRIRKKKNADPHLID